MTKDQSCRLCRLVGDFAGKRVVVIGDVILDHYIWGRAERISAEAPVPVVEVLEDTYRLGNAANVAANIRSLGGDVEIAGVVGDDGAGKRLLEMLEALGAGTAGLVVDPERQTTVKTRVVARHQQVVRIDRESRAEICGPIHDELIAFAAGEIPTADAVIVADVNKGAVVGGVVASVIAAAAKRGIPVLVDPRMGGAWEYRGATLITPNTAEAGKASGIDIVDDESLRAAAATIMERLDLGCLLITRGEAGMSLFERAEPGEPPAERHIPTAARDVFDVTGAGDTVVAVCALALAATATPYDAALLSNYAAGVVVGKVGTATVSREELVGAVGGRAVQEVG